MIFSDVIVHLRHSRHFREFQKRNVRFVFFFFFFTATEIFYLLQESPLTLFLRNKKKDIVVFLFEKFNSILTLHCVCSINPQMTERPQLKIINFQREELRLVIHNHLGIGHGTLGKAKL